MESNNETPVFPWQVDIDLPEFIPDVITQSLGIDTWEDYSNWQYKTGPKQLTKEQIWFTIGYIKANPRSVNYKTKQLLEPYIRDLKDQVSAELTNCNELVKKFTESLETAKKRVEDCTKSVELFKSVLVEIDEPKSIQWKQFGKQLVEANKNKFDDLPLPTEYYRDKANEYYNEVKNGESSVENEDVNIYVTHWGDMDQKSPDKPESNDQMMAGEKSVRRTQINTEDESDPLVNYVMEKFNNNVINRDAFWDDNVVMDSVIFNKRMANSKSNNL